MTNVTDLPRDLAEDVLSRVPVTSMRAVRFTCKKWNTLSKRLSFTKKQIGHAKAEAKKKQEKEFQLIVTLNYKVYLMSVNLHGIHKDENVQSSIKQKGKLIALTDPDRVVRSSIVFHCSGLLLCITGDENSKLVVWNPYSGQTRLIEPRNSYHKFEMYALGYEMKNQAHQSHKILRYLDAYENMDEDMGEDMDMDEDDMNVKHQTRRCEFEIYDFDSNSWKDVEVIPDWNIAAYQLGVSLKGNTYWFAQEDIPPHEGDIELQVIPSFLLCFDFTTESFGSRLPLPFDVYINDTITLSSVREEQLAVLYHSWVSRWTTIYISNKIEPNEVSWSMFLLVDMMRPLSFTSAKFFVDEEKKVAMIFDKGKSVFNPTRNMAYIVGENGYRKQVDLGEAEHPFCFPLVCSYVSSSVQI